MSNTKVQEQQHKEKRNKYYSGNVFKTLLKVSWPILLFSLFTAVYSFIDTAMAANLVEYPDGSNPSRLVGIVSPFISVFYAFSTLFFVGTGIVYTKSLSENDYEKANKVAGQQVTLSFLYGSLLIIILWFVSVPYLQLFQNDSPDSISDEMIADARGFISLFATSFIFLGINEALRRALRTEGKGGVTLVFHVGWILVNLLLNWIFMGPAKMGFIGGGVATFVSSALSTIAMFIFVKYSHNKGDISLDIEWKHLLLDKKLIKIVAIFGVTSVVRRLVMSYTNVSFSLMVATLPQEGWKEFLTVIMKTSSFLSYFSAGIGQALGMLIAYWGPQKENNKMKKSIIYGFGLAIFIQLILTVIMISIHEQLFALFNIGDLMTSMHIKAFVIAISGIFMSSFISIAPFIYASFKDLKSGFIHIGVIFVLFSSVLFSMYFGVYKNTNDVMHVIMAYPIALAASALGTTPLLIKKLSWLSTAKV